MIRNNLRTILVKLDRILSLVDWALWPLAIIAGLILGLGILAPGSLAASLLAAVVIAFGVVSAAWVGVKWIRFGESLLSEDATKSRLPKKLATFEKAQQANMKKLTEENPSVWDDIAYLEARVAELEKKLNVRK